MSKLPHYARSAWLFIFLLSSTAISFAGSATYQYFRFTTVKVRDPATANSVQASELRVYSEGSQVTGATASNPGGNNPDNERPENLVDNNTSTKWLDFNFQPVILDFGSPTTIDRYRFGTANDSAERDPIRWTFEGSNDSITWFLLDDRSDVDQSVTLSRRALNPRLELNQRPDTPAVSYSATAGGLESRSAIGITQGESASLSWEVLGADTITLNGAPVSEIETQSVTPSVTTDYEIIATNSFGPFSLTITVYVQNSIRPPSLNEFLANPGSDPLIRDEDGDPSDWIELYNPNPFIIDAGGFLLSDDPNQTLTWEIPSGTTMEGGEYLLVFASGKNRSGSELHSNFTLSKEGGVLLLLTPGGVSIYQGLPPSYPIQTSDVSYGIVGDEAGGGWDFFTVPTPQKINDTFPGPPGSKVIFVTPPQSFSNSLNVTLSAERGTASIRYTTDGSIPDSDSSLYSSPITLISSTLVRARTFEEGLAPGPVKAEGYLRLTNVLRNNATSNLPIIVVDNFNGGGVPSSGNLQSSYFTLFEPDPATGRTALTSLPTKANRVGIKRRGSSTQENPKGNYRVEFWKDDSEKDKSINLLGMSDHDEWILFAPYSFDRALIRNSFMFGLSNDIGTYAPKARFVEVYLNTGGTVGTDDYQGIYVLEERISRDKDRVDIDRLDPNDLAGERVTGGYILSIDRRDPGDQGFRSALGHPFDPPNGTPQPFFNFVYPKEQNIAPAQADYIKGYVDDFEAALYGPDFKDPEIGYRAWFEVGPAIDHHILRTFSKDPDGLRLSTYLYKPRNGKLTFGPIWDFDRTMGCDNDNRAASPTGFNPLPERAEFFDYDYWGRFFDDLDFDQAWTDRWQELRRGEMSNAAMLARVDALAEEITEAQPRNQTRWPAVSPNGGPLSSLGGWAGEIDHLKNWMTERADWIDTQLVVPPTLAASATVSSGSAITATAEQGSLYYTLDGSDPRLPGGMINPTAFIINGSGNISIPSTTIVIARDRSNGEWSGVVESIFVVGEAAGASNLIVSEIMYHPADANQAEVDAGFPVESDFEYLELRNISSETIDLTGVTISGAFDFTIGEEVLAPNSVALLVRYREAFEFRYGTGLPIVGEYGDRSLPGGGKKLSNSGEIITVSDLVGEAIESFAYDDNPDDGWPVTPDGSGVALVRSTPLSVIDPNLPISWNNGLAEAGTPGISTDSVYDEWLAGVIPVEMRNDPSIADPLADPDRDGLSNLVELAMNTNPLAAIPDEQPVGAIMNFVEGDYLTLTFIRRKERPDFTVQVKYSSDLSDWSQQGVLLGTTDLGNGTESVTYRDTDPIDLTRQKKFTRVEVRLN